MERVFRAYNPRSGRQALAQGAFAQRKAALHNCDYYGRI